MKHKNSLSSIKRAAPSRDEFKEALRQIMLSPSANRPKSQNREPTKADLEQRYKLTRRK